MANAIITPEEAQRDRDEKIARKTASIGYSDYDKAMEDYIYEVRAARGYTDRSPCSGEYMNGTNQRWKQDALDWIPFFQQVMTYGLEVENAWAAGQTVPTLEEFKTHLRTIEIHWTYEATEA